MLLPCEQPLITLLSPGSTRLRPTHTCSLWDKSLGHIIALSIHNNFASAGIDICFDTTSLYMEHLFFHISFRNDFCCPYSCQMLCNYFWRNKVHYYSMLLVQQNSALNKKHYRSVWCSWKPGSNISRTRMGRSDTRSHPTPTNDMFLEAKLHRRKPNCYICSGGSRYCTKLNNNRPHPQETSSGGFPSQVPLTPGKAKLTWMLSTPTFTELINPCCWLSMPSCASRALRSWQVQTRSSGVRISNESPWPGFHPTPVTWTQGCQALIASASLEGHIPEARASQLIPRHARAFDVMQPGRSSSSCSVIARVPSAGWSLA